MKSLAPFFAAALPLLLLAGCVTAPTGPTVMALPGAGKSFEQFRLDDAECRQYAYYQLGGSEANQAGVDAAVRSAAIGTAIGAIAGAAIGGRSGAGVGAGVGLVMGSAAGTGAAQSSAYGMQRDYDNTYTQCMYARGEQVPVAARVYRVHAPAPVDRPVPPGAYIPPPPYGSPPRPPAGYPPGPPPGYPPPPPDSPLR
ncbi:conserved exported hypothetical protein [Candidatus Accumulibacter aalborgensis]|uniref:Uncharacterized protein n=1 Tax=Candidatus Accumulibacter aalborgensis TaxID=1860102 RepID=A0A1A8XZR6_9PROT|nr:glycine zipper family protein [Candidatus Accumulibacter aalborgensis]SBT10211.1 conserved exported hypothetical protein [Candidatus Accumulibacter aalborgensis]